MRTSTSGRCVTLLVLNLPIVDLFSPVVIRLGSIRTTVIGARVLNLTIGNLLNIVTRLRVFRLGVLRLGVLRLGVIGFVVGPRGSRARGSRTGVLNLAISDLLNLITRIARIRLTGFRSASIGFTGVGLVSVRLRSR